MARALDIFFSIYDDSIQTWGPVIERIDTLSRDAQASQGTAPQAPITNTPDAMAWRAVFCTASGVLKCPCDDGVAIDPDAAELHQCSWCGTPSALLKKCRKCQSAL